MHLTCVHTSRQPEWPTDFKLTAPPCLNLAVVKDASTMSLFRPQVERARLRDMVYRPQYRKTAGSFGVTTVGITVLNVSCLR
jgi:hypothetical protein